MKYKEMLKEIKKYYNDIEYKHKFDNDIIKACEEDNLYDTIANNIYEYNRQELKSLILNLLDLFEE